MVPTDGASTAVPAVSAAALRRLWDQGRRAQTVRAVVASWPRVLAERADLRWLEGVLRQAGLPAEATAVQAEMAGRSASDARTREALVRSVLDSGDPWWARELLDASGPSSRALQALRIEAELALGDATESIAAWVREQRDAAACEAAVEWWVRSGRVEEAERLLEQTPGLPVWRARLALWRGDFRSALATLHGLPPSADVACLTAVAAVLEGRLGEAEAMLRGLVQSDVRPAAWIWLATVLRKQGRYEEAVDAADQAKLASTAVNLVPHIERDLASEYGFLRVKGPDGGAHMRVIGELEYAPALHALGLQGDEPLTALEGLLDRLAGNRGDRTPHLTTLESGRLVSHRLPLDTGHLGVSVQRLLWTRGAEAARALYRDLTEQLDGHPRLRIYHGELELWMGEYAEAERIFHSVLERQSNVRWAWIGLGASVMLQGGLREAQRIWEKGASFVRCAGPTLYVYRGECHRRQGDAARARADLEEALRQKPQRISARINLALLDGDPQRLAAAEAECTRLAPLLMEVLRGDAAERLEKVLTAMRGNRSSSVVSYHLWNRLWRGIR